MHGTYVLKVFADRSIEFGILNLEAFLIRPKTDEDELLPELADYICTRLSVLAR